MTSRMKHFVVNVTQEYGTCKRHMLQIDSKNPVYYKYLSPTEPTSTLLMKPAYQYDYQFDDKEIYAMTWTRKKIEFLNYLARDWGNRITKEADKQCNAPL